MASVFTLEGPNLARLPTFYEPGSIFSRRPRLLHGPSFFDRFRRKPKLLQGPPLPDLLGVPSLPQLLGISPALSSLLGFAGATAVGVGLGVGAIWAQKKFFKKSTISGAFGFARPARRRRKRR